MPHIRVKPKYQITIPKNVRKTLSINEGDKLEARAENGRLIFVPQPSHDKMSVNEQQIDISRYIGSMKGTYGNNLQEIDEYIRKERNSWN